MAAQLYHSKQFEGYVLTAGNLTEVGAWCGGTVDAIAGTVTIDIAEGVFSVSIGEMITKDLDGNFMPWLVSDFSPYYETDGSLSVSDKVDPAADSIIKVQSNVESIGNASEEVTVSAGYFKASNSTADQANVQIVGLLARATLAKNALDAYALQSHLSLGAAAESTGNLTAISGKTILGKSNASGIVSAGLFTVEGDFAPNLGYGVWIDIVDAALAAGLEINCNGGTLAAGVKLDKSGDGAITKDIVLQNGESIDNATNGLVNVTGNIGVNGTKVVGAQVAAIGLNAETDGNKITAIIAALRAHGLLGPNA